MPRLASSKRPAPRGHGAGERAAHVAEQLGLEQRLGDRAAVDRHEPLRAARAVVVNGARDELLAGAGLAGDENRAAGLRHGLEQLEQLPHHLALADDALEAVPLLELLAQVGVLGAQPALLERRVDDVQQFVELERLLDEVARAALDGLDGVLHRAEAGDDDADDVGIERARLVEHRRAVGAAAEPQVGDDDVEGERGRGDDGLLARRGLLHVEAAVGEALGHRLAQRRLVFNEQNMSVAMRVRSLTPCDGRRQAGHSVQGAWPHCIREASEVSESQVAHAITAVAW